MAKSGDGHINGADNDWFGSCDDDAVLKHPVDLFEDINSGDMLEVMAQILVVSS
jgi:hypothetical protein